MDRCDAVITTGFTKQNNYGLAGQTTWTRAPSRANRNQLTAGAAWDRSSLTYQQSTQFGYINPDRTITPVNSFADGSTTSNGAPVDTRVTLHGLPQTWSWYATDTFSLGKAWSFTISGRYNRTTIDNRDRIHPGGGANSLNGQYAFGRLNPSAGATFSPNRFVNLYASYSEANRAPASIELGCANPLNPCNLPNALVGDPPLKQVVARTVEAGIRSGGAAGTERLNWSAGWFRANNHDDLLFVASQQTGNGYFKNFGETLRQGAEIHASGRIGRFTWGGNYTFLKATYESPETVDGHANSANDTALGGTPGMDGVIQILAGDRIPLIPEHLFKAFADVQVIRRLSADVDFIAVSRSFARGNENNLSSPLGPYYLGPGTSPGYGAVNAGARYRFRKRWQVFVQINNALNHRYYTGAQLSATGFTDQGTFIARPFPQVKGNYPIVHATFYSAGAPFGAWGGVKFAF